MKRWYLLREMLFVFPILVHILTHTVCGVCNSRFEYYYWIQLTQYNLYRIIIRYEIDLLHLVIKSVLLFDAVAYCKPRLVVVRLVLKENKREYKMYENTSLRMVSNKLIWFKLFNFRFSIYFFVKFRLKSSSNSPKAENSYFQHVDRQLFHN